MHKSQLAGIVVDCEGGDLDEAARFWGQALGHDSISVQEPDSGKYRALDTGLQGIQIMLQEVDHPSRVHIDIETDDVELEVQRLETLGAKKIEKVKTWWVMEAPTGHRFCVVRPQREDFAENANEWS